MLLELAASILCLAAILRRLVSKILRN